MPRGKSYLQALVIAIEWPQIYQTQCSKQKTAEWLDQQFATFLILWMFTSFTILICFTMVMGLERECSSYRMRKLPLSHTMRLFRCSPLLYFRRLLINAEVFFCLVVHSVHAQVCLFCLNMLNTRLGLTSRMERNKLRWVHNLPPIIRRKLEV